MPLIRIFPLVVFLVICASSHGEEYRTFTGSNGRKIEARFVSFDEENQTVKIVLKDGREQTVLLSLFCDKDKEFIRNDEKTDNPFEDDSVIEKEVDTKQKSITKKPESYRTRGKDIIGPNGKATRWRGMNICAFIDPTPKDAEEMKEMNVNVVRYMFGVHFYNGKFTPKGIEPMAKSKRSFVKDVELFTKEGIGVIPVVGTNEPMPWHDEKKNEEFLKLWKHIIDELKHNPGVVAWDLYNEPHDVDDEALAKWYKKIIPIIRQYDPHRPIIIEGGGWGGVGGLKESLLVRDKNIIYSFHSYYPGQYTKQKKENPVQYPTEDHDINTMAKTITPAVQFRERFNVPVICGEWGVRNLAPNQDRWIKDMATVLETYEIDWLFWAWAWKHESERTVGFGVDKTYSKKYDLMFDIYKNPQKYRRTNRRR